VWCSGVTYERSRDARIEESGSDVYALVYDWGAPISIEMTIRDAHGPALFGGSTSTANMKRSLPDLVSWLVRDNPVPPGSVLLTGTGLVPPDDFSLLPGHMVEFHVPEIGTLTSPVVRAADVIERPDHS
jgi:2-dehydro-3-deoxy-D-arabinonate dehydratase